MYRHHRSALGLNSDGTVEQLLQSESGCSHDSLTSQLADEAAAVGDIYHHPSDSEGVTQVSTSDIDSDLHARTALKFLLQLREGRQVSQAVVSDAIDGCRTLCKETAHELKKSVRLSLASAGISVEGASGKAHVLAQDLDPFKGVDTNYLYEKFCIEHFGCLVSVL